ncbi:hypothetical protein CS298_26215, partial [Pseudomonas syringae pv. actinidiae]
VLTDVENDRAGQAAYLMWERACSRRGRYIRCIYCVWKIAFASKLAPSVPGMGRNQPLESSGQTK